MTVFSHFRTNEVEIAICARAKLHLFSTHTIGQRSQLRSGRCLNFAVNSAMAVTFEWDPDKAAANVALHGVHFDEASTVFSDPLGRIVDDPRHSKGEHRFVLVGFSKPQRLIAVMFTERRNRIRIISARPVTRAERRTYEESVR